MGRLIPVGPSIPKFKVEREVPNETNEQKKGPTMKDQILLHVEELEERIAPGVLGGGHPAQTANPEHTANPEGSAIPENHPGH